MTDKPKITRKIFEWNGVTISMTCKDEYLTPRKGSINRLAHIQVHSISPERAPFPITNTEYKSHFVYTDDMNIFGGPKDYILAWISRESQSSEWQEREEKARQLTLF